MKLANLHDVFVHRNNMQAKTLICQPSLGLASSTSRHLIRPVCQLMLRSKCFTNHCYFFKTTVNGNKIINIYIYKVIPSPHRGALRNLPSWFNEVLTKRLSVLPGMCDSSQHNHKHRLYEPGQENWTVLWWGSSLSRLSS